MANNNGIISAPIGLIPDVYGVLNLVAQGGLYDIGYACQNSHGRINRWAKYKPTRAGDTQETPADWWKGLDGMCGLDVPVYSTPGNLDSGFVHDIVSGDADWGYLAPREHIDWSRILDFEGYNHNAGCPFGKLKESLIILNGGNADVDIVPPTLQAQGQLRFEDFALNGTLDLTDMRLGVVLWNDDQTRYAVRSDITAQGSTSLEHARLRNMTGFTGVSWNARPIFCSDLIDGTVGIVGKYIASGNNEVVKLRFSLYSDLYVIEVTGTKVQGVNTVQTTVVLENNSTEDFVFQNLTIRAATPSSSGSAGYDTVGLKALGSYTVPAGTAVNINEQYEVDTTINILSWDSTKALYVTGGAVGVTETHYNLVTIE
jgi:hypothetical protein